MATLKTIKSREEMIKWADSRETSIEIAAVIFEYATSDEMAQKVWEQPTDFEMAVISMLAFDKAEDKENDTLSWGAEEITKPVCRNTRNMYY